MKFNKIIIVSLLLLVIFSISAASAAEDTNITQISDGEICQIDNGDTLEIPEENNEIIKDSNKTYLDYEIEIDDEIMQNYQGEYIHIKNMPKDYTGQISEISVDGGHPEITICGDGLELDFTQFTAGLHNITILTTETDKYLETTKTAYFNVSAVKVLIPTKIISGSNEGIRIYAPFAKEGTVVVNVDGNVFKTVDLSKVKANYDTNYTIPLGSLSYPAVHLVEVISTTGNYQTIKRANVSVSGYELYVSIIGTGTYGGDSDNVWFIQYNGARNCVEVIMPTGGTGKPKILIDGVAYNNMKFLEDRYSVDISSLAPGMHTLNVSYSDSKHHYNEYIETFRVRTLITYPATTEYTSGDAVSLTLPENATGNLKVYISDEYINYENESMLYNSVKMENGKASIPISDLKPGKYYIHAVYDGDDYDVKAQSGALTIQLKCIVPKKVTYGEDKYITVISSPDDNTTLKYYLKGKAHILQLVNGTGTIPLKDAPIRTRLDIPIHYNETPEGVENDYIKMITLRVYAATKLTGAKDISMYYADESKYSVKVYGIYGDVVGAGEKVTFYVGTTKKTVETNAKGIASIAISKLPGTYKISATYKGVTVKNKVTVKKVLTLTTVKVKKSAKSLVLTATLKKGKKAIKNTKVTFTFNGKKYSAKTNSKGIAKYTIKKSVLKKLKAGKKVTYKATYKSCTVKKTATVKK